MNVIVTGYLNSRYELDVALLPSGLAQVVFVVRFALPPVRAAMGRWSPLLEASTRRTGRDVTWRHGAGVSWCGPVAYGGELHRDLLRRASPALRSLTRAWDPVAAAWRPVDPPDAPPAPVEEDDDDNALNGAPGA